MRGFVLLVMLNAVVIYLLGAHGILLALAEVGLFVLWIILKIWFGFSRLRGPNNER